MMAPWRHCSLFAIATAFALLNFSSVSNINANAAEPPVQEWFEGAPGFSPNPNRADDADIRYFPGTAQGSADRAGEWPTWHDAPRSTVAARPENPDKRAPQSRYKSGIYVLSKDYWLSYPKSIWRIASAPARFDGKDWIIATGVVAAGGALMALDRGIRDFWQDDIRGNTSETVSDIFDPFGDRKFALGALLGTYAISEVLDQTDIYPARRAKAASLLALESVLISGAITGGLKYVIGRERPNKSASQFQFDGPGHGWNRALPSGHATAAFAIASSVSEVYGTDYPWVPWILYPFATGTALSRIDRNKHWASDVFFGAAIGYFVGKAVTRYSPFLEEHNISVRPFAGDGEYGTTLARRF